jgi:hypothetical protein
MTRGVRYFLFLVCAVQLFFAVAFFQQWSFATNLWPFPGTTPLTFIFISSIFAAAAASTLWAAASENYGAMGGIALDYITILTPMAILLFQLGIPDSNSKMISFGIACVLGAFFGVGLFIWSTRFPINPTPTMPGFVRWSFVIFIIALFIVGGRLIFGHPETIPWKITSDLGVIMGWMFIGAAVYFIYSLLRPSWKNSAGQLAGFLAYDIVLIQPFLKRLPTVPANNRLGLAVYTGVVIYSGLLAIYFLFLHKQTRLWAR